NVAIRRGGAVVHDENGTIGRADHALGGAAQKHVEGALARTRHDDEIGGPHFGDLLNGLKRGLAEDADLGSDTTLCNLLRQSEQPGLSAGNFHPRGTLRIGTLYGVNEKELGVELAGQQGGSLYGGIRTRRQIGGAKDDWGGSRSRRFRSIVGLRGPPATA